MLLERWQKKILLKMNLLNYKKKICFISGSRSEYGLLKDLIIFLKKEKKLLTRLVITGSHLVKEYGNTISEINRDKIKIFKKIKISNKTLTSGDIINSSSKIITGLSNVFKYYKPDLVIVLGDRYEIFISCYVATIFKIPIAHICGGEETQGSYDNQFRHGITKMSHIHFVTNEFYKKNILRMGENKNFVFNVGSLAFANFKSNKFKSKNILEKKYKIKFRKKNFMVSIHSETIGKNLSYENLGEVFKAFDKFKEFSFIFTASNNDHGGGEINKKVKDCVKNNNNFYFINSFGKEDYFSMLNNVDGVIGNSSSGIIETPSFKIGSINLGNRQKGRIASKSVINCNFETKEIQKKILELTSKKFILKIKKYQNPYQSKKNILQEIKNKLLTINLKNITFKAFKN